MRIFEIYRKKILDHPHGYFLSLANCNISKSIAFGMQKKKKKKYLGERRRPFKIYQKSCTSFFNFKK